MAQRDGLRVAAACDQSLELDHTRARVIGGTTRLGEEELDRLAGPSGDVLQGRQRRPGSASLDEVDRGRRHAALAQLREAQAGFEARLLDGAWADIYAGEPASFGADICHLKAPAGHGPLTLYEIIGMFQRRV